MVIAIDSVRRQKQDVLNPQKFCYSKEFDNLVEDNTHIVATVLFRFAENEAGAVLPNNYIVTAYQKGWGKTMSEPIISYDEISDSLHISFAPGETATGIELNEHILVRINKAERRAVGLTLFGYSVLAQPTELGLRSLPLKGLKDLPLELRE